MCFNYFRYMENGGFEVKPPCIVFYGGGVKHCLSNVRMSNWIKLNILKLFWPCGKIEKSLYALKLETMLEITVVR